jgi:glycosyltransferase involved in cell wall biosynthesis
LPVPQRNRLLQQSKILLNVHYSNLRYFEWHRALIALANRCCLITETCEGFEPLVPGKHFVMAKAEDLIACCEYYLKHEHERQAIAEAGYDFVRQHFTQSDNCRGFLQNLKGVFQQRNGEPDSTFEPATNGSGSPVEPLPHSLAKDLSRKPLKLLLSALREDLSNTFRAAHSKPATNATTTVDPTEMARRIAIVSDLRRGYIERLEAQKKCQQRGETIFQLIDSSRFNDSAPAISVVITLHNYRAYVRQCLKSLEDSFTAKIPGGIEVVIVNDASTDDSLKRAVTFQRTSRHPMRVVDKRLNTGLADARNIGLQLARAPYVLIMDADNLVFPRALEQLHARIVKDGSASVYSILCRFENAQQNRQGLLSYYDWDPQMLVEHPYIDAMALFDRKQLIEIGGYDTELFRFGWFGWEDYDLWLRIADAKLRVSFVPNVLCLYRHHEKAMSNATNLFERELVAYLLERYHSLVEAYPPKRRIFGLNHARFAEPDESVGETSGEPSTSSNPVEAR